MRLSIFGALIACTAGEPEQGKLCQDGLDNDADGLTDCADPDCLVDGACETEAAPDFCVDCWGEGTGWL